jgi:hypothetical protein
VRALGKVESKEAEQESLLLEYEVPYRPFGKAILNCLPKEGDSWRVPPKSDELGWRDREDLRDLIVCSIDPPGELKKRFCELTQQDARTLMTRCTRAPCPTATSRPVSVSLQLTSVAKPLSSHPRHRRRLPLCACRQPHGLGGRIARYHCLPRRQAYRHASRAAGYQPLLAASLRGALRILGPMGRL